MDDKGLKNGTCKRSACDHSHAIHFNRITLSYYCTPCARRINDECDRTSMEKLCSWPERDELDDDGLLKRGCGNFVATQ